MHFPGEAECECVPPARLLFEGWDLFGRSELTAGGQQTEHLKARGTIILSSHSVSKMSFSPGRGPSIILNLSFKVKLRLTPHQRKYPLLLSSLHNRNPGALIVQSSSFME